MAPQLAREARGGEPRGALSSADREGDRAEPPAERLQALRRGHRNGWILVAVAIAYIVGALLLAWRVSLQAPPPQWDMGGTPFVPASAPQAEGYYTPETQAGRAPDPGEAAR